MVLLQKNVFHEEGFRCLTLTILLITFEIVLHRDRFLAHDRPPCVLSTSDFDSNDRFRPPPVTSPSVRGLGGFPFAPHGGGPPPPPASSMVRVVAHRLLPDSQPPLNRPSFFYGWSRRSVAYYPDSQPPLNQKRRHHHPLPLPRDTVAPPPLCITPPALQRSFAAIVGPVQP
jgi:hypothetical protein